MSQKKYIYPKLCDIDLYFTRIGALGLGNMLFPYARALLKARDSEAMLIKPTWGSIPIGPILRHEKDKRAYRDLFTYKKSNIQVINGPLRFWLLLFKKKDVEFICGMKEEFKPLLGKENAEYLKDHFKSILKDKNRPALDFNPEDGICLHVRLGDFVRCTAEELLAGQDNASSPISWYVNMVNEIRETCGKQLPVYLFSDGEDEELMPILSLPNIQRVFFGTAIADIMAMSNARLLLASCSTFARWARFLGRVNTLCFPRQLGMKLTDPSENVIEEEAIHLTPELAERIKYLYEGK